MIGTKEERGRQEETGVTKTAFFQRHQNIEPGALAGNSRMGSPIRLLEVKD